MYAGLLLNFAGLHYGELISHRPPTSREPRPEDDANPNPSWRFMGSYKSGPFKGIYRDSIRVVISGVISPLIWVISIATLLKTLLRSLPITTVNPLANVA